MTNETVQTSQNLKPIIYQIIVLQLLLIFGSALVSFIVFESIFVCKKLIICGIFSLLIWIFYLPVIRKVTDFKSVYIHLGACFSSQALMLIILVGNFLIKTN